MSEFEHEYENATKHGAKRLRKRLGLPKKTVDKMVKEAFEEGGKHGDFSGTLKRYMDKVFLKYRSAGGMRVHKQHLFIFTKNGLLITMWRLPNKMIPNKKAP